MKGNKKKNHHFQEKQKHPTPFDALISWTFGPFPTIIDWMDFVVAVDAFCLFDIYFCSSSEQER